MFICSFLKMLTILEDKLNLLCGELCRIIFLRQEKMIYQMI